MLEIIIAYSSLEDKEYSPRVLYFYGESTNK